MATSTWRTTYTPGSWIVLNGPKALVAAQPTSADIAERLSTTWNDVVAAVDLESLVGKLMRWGMDVIPDLIVVVDNERLQCVVRGDVTVTDVATGEVVANGHGQAAWRSVNLDARHIAITLPGQDASSTWRLPLAVGVVSAGSIDIDARDDARVNLGDATFAVAPLIDVPTVKTAPEPAEAEAPAVEPPAAEAPAEVEVQADSVTVPEDLQAPGAWATGFGDDVPIPQESPVITLGEPEAEAEANSESAAEAAVEPEPEAAAEPEPEHEAASDAEPETVTEPEPEPEHEAAVEPEPEATPEQPVETPVEPEVTPVAEVTETAAVDQVAEPVAEVVEPVAEPTTEPAVTETAVAEPATEPVADQVAEPVAEVVEPVADQVAEPVVEAAEAQIAEPIEVVQTDEGLEAQIEAAKAAVDQAIAESQVAEPEPAQAVEQIAEVAAEPVAAEPAMPEEAAPEVTSVEAATAEPATEVSVAVEPVAEEPASVQPEPAQTDLDKVDWQPAQVQPTPEPVSVLETVVPQPEAAAAPQPEPAPAPEAAQPDATPQVPAATGSPLGATLLVFSDGQRWPVNEPLLVGRAPQAYPGETAHLVRVVSPHHDISRTHVRIELYDGAMWATDRESTNGTTVHNPGQAAATAQPGQPMHVWVGGVIDIGDGVTIRVQ